MTVYIEYVILNNLVIDYLLLRLTFILTGKRHGKLRLFFCGVLGAVISLIFPLIKLGNFYLTILKALVGVLLLFLSVNFKSGREFYINFTVFCFLTFLFGGSIFAVYLLLGVENSSELAVFLCFLPAWALVYLVKSVVTFLYRRKNVECVIYPFEFTVCSITISGRGFLDTGNALYFKDNPVVICEMGLVKKLFGVAEVYKRMKLMKIATATGEGEKFCLPLDEFKIFIEDKPNIYNNVTLVIAKVDITGADLIIHPALVGVENAGKNNRQVKKVS